MVNNSKMHSFGGINSSLMLNKADDIGKPTTLQFSNQVLHVAFSPYSETHDLIIIVFNKELCIGSLKFRVSINIVV